MFSSDSDKLGLEIIPDMDSSTMDIDYDRWDDLRVKILEIKKKLGITDAQDPPMTPQQIAGLQMGGNVDGSPINVDGILHPGSIFSCGQGKGMEGGSGAAIGSLAMEEQCANQFKEILNVKERKVVDNGTFLDTDSLVAFRTGDVGELFKEERIVKKKKSKIFFLLDASGSMGTNLIDGQSRATVVKKSLTTLTQILDEVSSIEGLNVDWEIGAFKSHYIPLEKDTWKSNYNIGGGTQFEDPFNEVMEKMLKDYTIDGKRIIICFTDGDVADFEIENVRDNIARNFTDVRSLIISVGSTGQSKIAKEITGDNIIIAEDNAVPVIMETIKAML